MKTLLTQPVAPLTNIREAYTRLGLTTSFAARRIGITSALLEKIEKAQAEGTAYPCSTRTLYMVEAELHLEPGCLTGKPSHKPMQLPLNRYSYSVPQQEYRLPTGRDLDPNDHDHWKTGGRAFL